MLIQIVLDLVNHHAKLSRQHTQEQDLGKTSHLSVVKVAFYVLIGKKAKRIRLTSGYFDFVWVDFREFQETPGQLITNSATANYAYFHSWIFFHFVQ